MIFEEFLLSIYTGKCEGLTGEGYIRRERVWFHMKLCDVCNRVPAKILVTGEGDLCLDCYNARILNRIGKEDTFEYPRRITIMEPGGEIHTFDVEHVILGTMVSWEAKEVGGNYSFRECSDIDENGAVVAQRLFKKIVKGVSAKALSVSDVPTSNLLQRDGKTYGIGDKGMIHIIEDEDNGYETAFVIDGIKFSPEEFVRLFGGHPGFDVHFQIHDASDPVLGEDEYLVPVHITKDSLINELQMLINTYGDGGFIGYKDVYAFDLAFEHVVRKLEVLMESGDRKKALEAGKEIVRILESVETDDDYFPYGDIEVVCKTIDPFRTDDDLWVDEE